MRRALDRLRGGRNVVLTTHVNADGDGVGCEVALQSWLRRLGARVHIVNPTPFPEAFRFLLPDDAPVLDASTSEADDACRSADLAVVVDTGEIPRLGRVRPMIRDLDTIVVDHHPPGDSPISGISLRDPAACATGELIYDVFAAADGPWTDEAVRGLYVAILTDTGSFRFSNAGPRAHRVAGDLIARGVEPEEVHRRVYGSRSLEALRLLERSLGTLEVDDEGLVAWMVVPREGYRELGAVPEDLEGFVDYPRSVEGVEVGLLFRRTASGDTKISFRATRDVDVNALARRFGGGGHTKAAGALVSRPLEEVLPEVVEATRDAARRVRERERDE